MAWPVLFAASAFAGGNTINSDQSRSLRQPRHAASNSSANRLLACTIRARSARRRGRPERVQFNRVVGRTRRAPACAADGAAWSEWTTSKRLAAFFWPCSTEDAPRDAIESAVDRQCRPFCRWLLALGSLPKSLICRSRDARRVRPRKVLATATRRIDDESRPTRLAARSIRLRTLSSRARSAEASTMQNSQLPKSRVQEPRY